MDQDTECPTGEQVVAYWRELAAKYPPGHEREYSFSCGPNRGAAVLDYIDRLNEMLAERDALIEQLRGTLQFNRDMAARNANVTHGRPVF